MATIAVLSDLVANQIAAGEVVERPASAVKELIENAVDAGATEVVVRVEGGGLTLIDVQDNGTGIAPDEAALAFVRHATSKLRALDDLRRLGSLGFRGEALPSIAAVSHVTLRTRQQGAEGGLELVIAGGVEQSRQPVGCPSGTRVIVTDLFYNTPARLKFVRSLQTESSHIVDVVAKCSAARPDIAFRAFVDGRMQWTTPGDGRLETVFATAFGVTPARSALRLLAEHADYTLRAVLALPEHSRANRTGLWFAVNGRPVRSTSLQNAVQDGFATAIPKGRYPLVLLSIVTDPSLVDVNVHPGKLEIRFSEERDVREFVRATVVDTLQTGMGPATAGAVRSLMEDGAREVGATTSTSRDSIDPDAGKNQSFAAPGGTHGFVRERPDGLADGTEGDALAGAVEGTAPRAFEWTNDKRHDLPSGVVSGEMSSPHAGMATTTLRGRTYRQNTPGAQATQMAFALSGPVAPTGSSADEPALTGARTDVATPFASATSASVHPQMPEGLRAVAQVMQMYIVAEDGDAVYLIDQHAAHERVLYERFRDEAAKRGLQQLELLVPLTIEVPARDFGLLLQGREQWQRFGLVVEPFGEQVLIVRAVPHIWEGLDIENLVRDVFLDQVAEELGGDSVDGQARTMRAWQDRLIMRSCKAAVKANQKLSLMEMNALLQSLSTLQNPFTCPHGRPTAIVLDRQRLEREFKRSL